MSSYASTYQVASPWVKAPRRPIDYRNAADVHAPSHRMPKTSSAFRPKLNNATRLISDLQAQLNRLTLHDISSSNDRLLRNALRGDSISTPEAEFVFANVGNALRNAPIERAQVIYYDDMFDFILYMSHNLKLTFTCFTSDNCVDSLLCPTFSTEDEIIAEYQIEFRSLAPMIESIYNHLGKTSEQATDIFRMVI